MTVGKKKDATTSGAKKKLQISKDTLKDLQTKKGEEGPRGGTPRNRTGDLGGCPT